MLKYLFKVAIKQFPGVVSTYLKKGWSISCQPSNPNEFLIQHLNTLSDIIKDPIINFLDLIVSIKFKYIQFVVETVKMIVYNKPLPGRRRTIQVRINGY
jgi:hypothetical protein